MKKIIILGLGFILLFASSVFANDTPDITGRWAEKISERVIMDILPSKNENEYQVFITWREDHLAQKDIYRFTVKKDKHGDYTYENGLHIYRYFRKNKPHKDRIDYKNGIGTLQMYNDELVWFDNNETAESSVFIRANEDLTRDTTTNNKLFSFFLPEECRGFYESVVEKDCIKIYDKESKKADFGGFAFGVKAYRNPKDHATLPGSKKIGELKDKRGRLYDMVIKYPTDVQYDYTKGTEPPAEYKLLYDLGDSIIISGVKGCTYYPKQGTKGEDLYKEVLKKHITAIKEKWDSTKLEKEHMSYMYNVLAENKKEDVLDKVGYAYYDANADGIDELIIGEIAQGEWKGVIYDMYTMVNRKPKHVLSGGSRNRFFVTDGTFLANEYSSGAGESGVRIYILLENSTEIFPQVSFKYDSYKNKEQPWFWSYGSSFEKDEWENVTEEAYKERKEVFDRYERFDYIPLSKVKL